MTYNINGFGEATGLLWTGGNLDWMSAAAGDDFLGTNTPGSVTFTGLGTTPWMLEVVSANNSNNMGSNFTVDGSAADRTFTGAPVQNPWPGTSGQANWLIWDALTPSGGSLALDYSNSSSYFGINAMRLTQVPEPSTYTALFAAAALGLAVWRRKSKA